MSDDHRRGLYDPSFEHDACGVGLVCNIDGTRSNSIVQDGLTILCNLDHRGARGSDPETGDGAGILIQLPDLFFRSVLGDAVALPEAGLYAVGVAFLSRKSPERFAYGKELVESSARAGGLNFLGWRKVPVRDDALGETASRTAPHVWQFFVSGGTGWDQAELERRAFLMRRRIETDAYFRREVGRSSLYIASLSCRTMVYKGMLTVDQVALYYPDLGSPLMESAVAMVHSRFSTNTLPTWSLAHPFRILCHNGEINTLRGNVNRMRAREAFFQTRNPDESNLLRDLLTPHGSDSQNLDNAVELLVYAGRSLPHALMMLVPEAWEKHESMNDNRRAFYEYNACLMEPWDGPATIPFTDGRFVGALLDRNGLRPSRYTITRDGRALLASETGVLDIAPENVVEHGRLTPGRMFLVDLLEGRIVDDEEIKNQICNAQPYGEWLADNLITLESLKGQVQVPSDLDDRQRDFMLMAGGYSIEDLNVILYPMAADGKEPLGSMGNDTPLAVLSTRPRLLYDYFKQLFAQVTNPPIDAIREERVTSLIGYLGRSSNILEEKPAHARVLKLEQPILTVHDLDCIRSAGIEAIQHQTIDTVFSVLAGEGGLRAAVNQICTDAETAVREGMRLLVLSDRTASDEWAAMPALIAVGAVHQHLIRCGLRSGCSLIVESAEPREVHHFCSLLGFGAEAVCPYLAFQVVREAAGSARLGDATSDDASAHYVKAVGDGILKVMSKMGISTLRSYVGAQVFEAVGVNETVVDEFFTGTSTRIGGVDLEGIAADSIERHATASQRSGAGYGGDGFTGSPSVTAGLDEGGIYQWRRTGEEHLFSPLAIARLQQSVRDGDYETYNEYSKLINERTSNMTTLRGLLEFTDDVSTAIPIDEVQPWTEIVKQFKSGAMSYGSLSLESHETLAVAMNSLGAKSNSGEGGEAAHRFGHDNPRRSRIKQVASGRFGVTISYLESADELQIKMAQGAKPGEGGQLPGDKVYPWIAETRKSTPYVGLISPPPHHDIYSIEDLAQLIFDLKNANPRARISVKLVSEVGVGTVAAGVAKAKADVILISGHDGGTGASPQTSLMHAGLPWELGLSETHQTLVRNGLRKRVKLECDGQLKTGRDVAIAALLGADEFGFATAPLVAMGCIMMRKCHLNTCPVGIATQDPALREKFTGQPEHVVNFLHFVAEELRQIMAGLGLRTLQEMVGRVDLLKQRENVPSAKLRGIDLSRVLEPAATAAHAKGFSDAIDTDDLADALDHRLIASAMPALEGKSHVEFDVVVRNIHRTVGTLLSYEIARRHGVSGLPADTIRINASGTAGQSFAAFGAPGLTIDMVGEANDYFGKGLSGARLILRPPDSATFDAHRNTIVGNVALYGATGGELFVRGRAGERFAVRNSGATAVVEGVGDHGCEYMTGGVVVVLGQTGRNFGAGMSGGIAYVLDGTHDFRTRRWNREMVELHPLDTEDRRLVRELVERHSEYTGSVSAQWVLDNWDNAAAEFLKIFPTEYRLALEKIKAESAPANPNRRKAVVSLDRDLPYVTVTDNRPSPVEVAV